MEKIYKTFYCDCCGREIPERNQIPIRVDEKCIDSVRNQMEDVYAKIDLCGACMCTWISTLFRKVSHEEARKYYSQVKENIENKGKATK